jgi:hypothetical protein
MFAVLLPFLYVVYTVYIPMAFQSARTVVREAVVIKRF